MKHKTPKYIAAIDIGTSKVATLVGERTEDGRVKIIAGACSPTIPNAMVRGDVKNISSLGTSIQKTLKAIEEDDGIVVKEAFVGLSGQHIRCVQHSEHIYVTNEDGDIKAADVETLINNMYHIRLEDNTDIIDILPQSYSVGNESNIKQPVGMIGNKLEGIFNIIVGDKKKINFVNLCLQKQGIKPVELILSPLASAEAVLDEDEKELGVVVVDIGGGTCDIAIYHDNDLHFLGVIPLGSELINKDIKSFGILERFLEGLKTEHGNALPSTTSDDVVITLPSISGSTPKEIPERTLSEIIEARMMDILKAVVDIVSESGFADKMGAGIVLTGGGANLKNVDKLFIKHLGCNVRIGTPSLHVDCTNSEIIYDPKFSTAVGLLLRGAESGAESKVDFVNKDTEPKEKTERKVQPEPVAEKQEEAEINFEGASDEPAGSDNDNVPEKGRGGRKSWWKMLGDLMMKDDDLK